MARIVRGALLQAEWTGDKESMIQKHEELRPRGGEAGRPGHAASRSSSTAPTSARSRIRSTTATPSTSPTARPRSGCRRWPRRPGMVLVVPMYEEDEQATGIYYNTAAVIDADGTYLGKYRKTHIPHVKGFWEKFYFRPGNLGLPGLRDGGRQGRRLHLLRPPLPRGRPRARPQRRRDRLHPVGDVTRPVRVPVARSSRSATRVANGYFVGTINRVGIEPDLGDDDFYGQSLLRRSARPVHRRRRRRRTTRS